MRFSDQALGIGSAMKAVIGVVVIAIGVAIFLLAERMSRANSAAADVVTGGRMGGSRMTGWNTANNRVTGIIAVAAGIALIIWQVAS